VNDQLQDRNALPLRKSYQYQLERRVDGLRTGLDVVLREKFLPLSGTEPWFASLQPVTSLTEQSVILNRIYGQERVRTS
jgi:hypothetical protein